MKIIVVLDNYGGNCNSLFQSLHYNAYAIENECVFFNPYLIGILRFDNIYLKFFNKVNNFYFKLISKIIFLFVKRKTINIFFGKENYIKFVRGWDFRVENLTEKHHEKLKKIYQFDKSSLKNKSLYLLEHINNLKMKSKFVVGLHIRRGDYKDWNGGKYFFDNEFYNNLIEKLKKQLIARDMYPYIFAISDENVSNDINCDFLTNGSWEIDQIVLQSCDLIIGPPSTFSMWASYISKIPLIHISSLLDMDLEKQIICKG